MKPLSDQDWEWVNAWADGELAAPEAEAFSKRLEDEPALKEALASVRQVTSALSVLRPEPGRASNSANINSHPWFRAAGAAVIATAAAVAVVAVLILSNPAPTALEVHRTYAAQEYQPTAQQPALRRAANSSVDGFPRLGDANLSLVAINAEKGKASAHYIGVNGCRLTVLRGAYAQPQETAGVQAYQWMAENTPYQVIATGMDTGKFAATATYLEQSTQNRLQEVTILALHKAVQSASNCRLDVS